MFRWSRIALAVLWALTVVFAAQWGASARQQQPPGVGTTISGADLGFRVEGMRNGEPYGRSMVRIGGQWLAVTDSPGGIVPAR
jgi:hypothetical protein